MMKAKDLKNSILQLAVQGKLVEQDPSDEPASALLERIREERQKLIAAKKIKAPKGGESVIWRASDGSYYEKRVDVKGRESEPVCIDEEIPFEIPENWEWSRLGSLLQFVSDGTHKTPSYKESGVLFLSVQNISAGYFDLTKAKYISQEEHEMLCRRVKPQRNDILLCRIGTLGKPIIIENDLDFSIFVSLGLLRPIDSGCNHWIVNTIDSPLGFVWIQDVKVGGGTHTSKLNLGDIPSFLMPIPPLTEQRHIVERIEELMPLVEEYGKLEDEREAMDAELPERLRKSVLQMAVQGKLVDQDPADEPASILMERIREERQKLIAAKKIKAPKGGESVIWRASDGSYYEKRVDAKGRESEPVCIDDEIPFEIPESWEWARLSSIGEIVGGGTPKTTDQECWAVNGEGISWLTPADMKYVEGWYVSTGARSITEHGLKSSSAQLMPARSVLMSSRAPIGYLAIASNPIATNQGFKSVVPQDSDWSEWILTALEGRMENIKERSSGTTFKEISGSEFALTLIPIPPLAEQRRIVERIEELEPLFTNR